MKLVWFSVVLVVLVSLGAEGLRIRRPFPNRIRMLHEDQCGSVVRIDCLDREVRRQRFRQRLLSSSPLCAQLTDEQLLKKLKDIGGYNPLYVAINKTEAKKFKDPRTFEMTETPTTPRPTRAKECNRPTTGPTTRATPVTPTTVPTTRGTTPSRVRQYFRTTPLPRGQDSMEEDPEKMSPIDNVFEKLREKERPEEDEPKQDEPEEEVPKQDEPEEEVPEQDEPEEEVPKQDEPEEEVPEKDDPEVERPEQDERDAFRRRVKRSTVVQNCWKKGAYVNGSRNARRHMCSECQVVRQLPANVIPQYINEAACGHTMPAHSGQPSQDNQCIASTGICTQKVLRFPALVRSGYVRSVELSAQKGMEIYVEDWRTSTQEIRASCQCQMYESYAQLLYSINGG